MIIWKLIVHLIILLHLTSGVESEVTFVSIHASSKVITRYMHFATYMCYVNYKSMCHAKFPRSYYSQFAVKIIFENSVTGYITLLCIAIT